MSTAEKLRQEGREQGRKQGREEGRQEGKREGRQEGKREGLASGLAKGLRLTFRARFGLPGVAYFDKINSMEITLLEDLEALMEDETLDLDAIKKRINDR